jgi:transcriptional regulator of acetoin/glycerol metabolism
MPSQRPVATGSSSTRHRGRSIDALSSTRRWTTYGKRRYTVQRIADRLGVSRATIYRHLDPDKPVSA